MTIYTRAIYTSFQLEAIKQCYESNTCHRSIHPKGYSYPLIALCSDVIYG